MAIAQRLAPFVLLLALVDSVGGDSSLRHASLPSLDPADEFIATSEFGGDVLDYIFSDGEEDEFGFGIHRKLQNNNNNNNGGSSGSSGSSGGTTTTERCNFWCQLKNSMGKTIVGLLLICISPCLMWKNEGRHVNELRRIDFCKNKAVVVHNVDTPSDENNGQLVHFVGEVSVDDNALELAPGTPLNITSPLPKALVVKRTCLIYQKFEEAHQEVKNDVVGGGQTTTTTYTVREDWTPLGPQPEQLAHLPEETNSPGIWNDLIGASGGSESAAPAPGAESPPGMPPELAAMFQMIDFSKAPHGLSVQSSAHVGGFTLSKDIIMTEPAVFQAEWTPLPSDLIPEEVEGCPGLRKTSDGSLTTTPEGEQPTNGDVLVKYEYVVDGFEASFIVQQVCTGNDPESGDAKYCVDKASAIDDKCCGKIHDDLGKIWMVRRGRHDLTEMIGMAKKDEETITKVLRLVCWLVLVVGWILLFSIFTTVMSTLPILSQLGYFAVVLVALIVGTACCCVFTGLAYIRYRPVIAFGIIAISLAIWSIVVFGMGGAAANSNAPTKAPTKAFLIPADFEDPFEDHLKDIMELEYY